MTNNLVIIGSGLAGYMLAKEWRKLDQHTPLTIVTSTDGSFYSKPLLSTALTNNKTADNLVVADAKVMAGELKATILTHSQVLAINVAEQQIVLYDQQISYGRLILACGADIINPPLIGNALADMHAVNDLMAYRHFRDWLQGKQHIAILGAGLVGCEFANDLSNMGYRVSIIAPERHPLASLVPPIIGSYLESVLAHLGVSWHLGHFATAVEYAGTAYHVVLDNGQSMLADGVFSAVGLRPSLRLAQSAGLTVNVGVMVDRCLRTSDPNIYALGDCAEINGIVKQYVAPILQCARALAKILVGGNEPVDYPIMPIIIKTPACPIVVYPPAKSIIGTWHIEGDDQHRRALFYDQQGQLHGYALIGDKVRDKMSLAKELPVVFAD